jgi:ATP synthase protein I
MSASILAANRRHALQILMWQALTVAVVAVLAFVLWNARMAWSVLVGGGVGVVSTAYMAFALLRQNAQASAQRVAASFFVGWVIKVLLTIALLWIVFRSKAFAPLALLAGFATTFVAFGVTAFRRRD